MESVKIIWQPQATGSLLKNNPTGLSRISAGDRLIKKHEKLREDNDLLGK